MDNSNVIEFGYDAAYYIGAQLVAKEPVSTYSSPNGTLKKTYKKGAVIGNIQSWVTRDGFVWWQLTDNTFVKHIQGAFDAKLAGETSSGKAIETQKAEQKAIQDAQIENQITKALGTAVSGAAGVVEGAGDTLKMLGKTLPLLLVLAVVIFLYLQFRK